MGKVRWKRLRNLLKRKEEQFEKDKQIKVKDIGRKGKHIFVREAWVFMKQTNNPNKVFTFERLRKHLLEGESAYIGSKTGDIEYRVGYYIRGQISKMKNRWTWGQFCPMIPKEDLDKLLKLGKEKGVIL